MHHNIAIEVLLCRSRCSINHSLSLLPFHRSLTQTRFQKSTQQFRSTSLHCYNHLRPQTGRTHLRPCIPTQKGIDDCAQCIQKKQRPVLKRKSIIVTTSMRRLTSAIPPAIMLPTRKYQIICRQSCYRSKRVYGARAVVDIACC